MGLSFRNIIGLGAGFDKNAVYLDELNALGFGFVEIGTVTPRPQKGNDKPRLFRLQEDGALINRMGFNNHGVEVIATRLEQYQKRSGRNMTFSARMLIGGNIGKNKDTPNEEAWKDYETCFTRLHPFVDFFVVNVSSPNTPGLRELQGKEALKKILTGLQQKNAELKTQRPILLKIAPDLEPEQLDDVINLVHEIRLDGLVATNTTTSRAGLKTASATISAIGAGGLSGRPLKHRSTEILGYLKKRNEASVVLIGSGGIFSGKDAAEKLHAGASLLEVWTGFIYEGPAIVKNIYRYLKN